MGALATKPSQNPAGRAGLRTPERVQRIVAIVGTGKSLKEAAKRVGVAPATIASWLRKDPEFRDAVTAARSAGAIWIEEHVMEKVLVLLEKGDARSVGEASKHLRWALSKRGPQQFGEQRQQTPQIAIQINTDLWSPEAGQPEIQSFHVEAPVDAEFTDAE